MVSALAPGARDTWFDPRGKRGNVRCPNTILLVTFFGDDTNAVHRPSDRDVNWSPVPVQEHLAPVQVKGPYISNLNGYL